MSTPSLDRLRAETALYESRKAEWLRAHPGRFVVVRDAEVLGFYDQFHEAYYAGVERFGQNTDFLVKRVAQEEPVYFVY